MSLFEWMQMIWGAIIAIAVVMYTVLDGFDLGVGGQLLSVKKDEDRRVLLNSIGPFWDGNEVWLIIIGGGLFAGFPAAYATLFSAMYAPTMCLLGGIIFRAVAIEFRSKRPSTFWRSSWDILFCVASLLISFMGGVFLGNLIMGLPINQAGDFVPGSFVFFNPYAMLVGVMAIFLFLTHGNLFLMFKTEGALKEKLHHKFTPIGTCFAITYLLVTAVTFYAHPRILARFMEMPFFSLVPILGVLSIIGVMVFHHEKRYGLAFLCSSLTITLLFANYAIGAYPYLLYSTLDPAHSLTIFNASAGETTMKVLLVIAAIGVPLVLAYFAILYTIFHGKTRISSSSY